MALRLLGGSAATLLLSLAVYAQIPPTQQVVPDQQIVPDQTQPERELTLIPVPALLRLHLPILGETQGVLVESVTAGSAAHKTGLRPGDVLLEAGGRGVIQGDAFKEMDAWFPMVVIRRGRTQVLRPGGMPPRGWIGQMGRLFTPSIDDHAGGVSVTSSASSSGLGNRAVSVSRAGDQIALEISLPDLVDGPIRMQGTAAEIERQLQTSTLSPPAKREIRAALQQTR